MERPFPSRSFRKTKCKHMYVKISGNWACRGHLCPWCHLRCSLLEYYLNIACKNMQNYSTWWYATWWHAKCLIHLGEMLVQILWQCHYRITSEGGKEWMNVHGYLKEIKVDEILHVFFGQIQYTVNLDLPKGAKWLLKGVNSPSLRVSLAPLGRCWNVYM